jgi:hypothetical protein
MPKSGRWRVESKTDPRFNLEGHGEVDLYPLRIPTDASEGIQHVSEELRAEPPEDLEFSFTRDPSTRPPPPPPFVDDPAGYLVDTGLLFELNRRVLHPLGLALEVVPQEGDHALFQLEDYREEPHGLVHSDAEFADGLSRFMKFMDETGTKKLLARRACRGFLVQGDTDY